MSLTSPSSRSTSSRFRYGTNSTYSSCFQSVAMIAAGGSDARVVTRTPRTDDPATPRRSITTPSPAAPRPHSPPAARAAPLAARAEAIRRFRALAVERAEPLAHTLTLEVGKPITQARRELAGLLPRVDFFLAAVEGALADEVVLASSADGLEERIAREPLGLVANVSAWNYPGYVGATVFLPSVLTGDA